MKHFLFIISICVVVVGSLVYGMWYAAAFVNEKRLSLVDIQKKIFVHDERQKNIKALESFLEDIGPQKEEVNGVFADSRSVVDFIKALERTARTAGIALDVEDAALPSSEADAGPEFRLRVRGSFNDTLRFVELLEAMPYQIAFDSVAIRKESSAGDWAATITITLLSFLRGSAL